MMVGQGPNVLAVGAGEGYLDYVRVGSCLDIYSFAYHSFFLSLAGGRLDID